MAIMNKVLILFSGGLDSRVLIHLATMFSLSPYCLGIDYGQKHKRELEKAESFCDEFGIPYESISVSMPVNSKLTGDLQEHYTGVSEWYVPSRNLMFISLAVAKAESLGINTVWFGANYDDRKNLFPDCYQEWVYEINSLLESNSSYPIKVEAPLLGFTKERVQEFAKYLGIKEEEVHSGYSE